jgi:DNA-binding transcriptional ArsR family regulator
MEARAPRTRTVTDPRVLKALSHPLRLRLYELLSALGPSTATRLAEHVDQAVGLLSYHVRVLADHGYVEEAPELATDGRERWWRVVPGGISWSTADFLDDPARRAVAATAERQLLGRQLDRLQTFTDEQDSWGRDWVDAAIGTDAIFRMTPEELREFGTEIQAVVARWAGREVPDDEQPRETVFHFMHTFPFRP